MSLLQRELFPDMNATSPGEGSRTERLILPKFLRDAGNDMRLRTPEQQRAYEILSRWANLETSGKLKKMKETTLQGEFLAEVFGEGLGYTLFSENLPQWHLQAQYPIAGGAADAALGFFGPEAKEPPKVLIELKGPKVNLDRDRFNGRTPIQQCWDYLNQVPQCPWGIVCNYISFRLYHRNRTPRAFELFTLEELRDDIERFRQFYCLFARGGLLPMLVGQRPRAEDLLIQTDQRQQEVSSELYAHYHEQRVGLINHLTASSHQKSLDEAIHITQKLLDRIVFVAFCEDRELLPAESIGRAWKEIPAFTRVTNPRWQNFLALFQSIDKGNQAYGINAYNGGLFGKDDAVDDLQLADDWTNFFKEISSYDFRDEVNVDVLGHLFEQSVTDLEALRAAAQEITPKRKRRVTGRRKHEGIYYTPPDVTGYLVQYTVGAYLQERFAALATEYDVDPNTEPTSRQLAAWVRYQESRLDVLRKLRVCDPACGSGAFLIQAFDFLENLYDEVIASLSTHRSQHDEEMRKDMKSWILHDNLFGVDLSEEAVEITRLALWIRTAEAGKTLADLSENIQHGNSIVDDPNVDPRAFDWQTRFRKVIEEGGFDCIITNPPYVKLQNFRKRHPKIAEFLGNHYRSAQTGNFDLYLPFIERALGLLKPESGRMGFIAPSVWLYNEYGQGLKTILRSGNR